MSIVVNLGTLLAMCWYVDCDRKENKAMRECKICGDDESVETVYRFWSPDDGWMTGRLCPYCKESFGNRKPQSSDYAYREHVSDYLSDPDDAMNEIFG